MNRNSSTRVESLGHSANLGASIPVGRSLIRPLFVVLTILVALPALADRHDAQSQKVFVPFESYVASRREEYRSDLVLNSGCTEQAIEAMLNHAEQSGYLFSAKNVVSAFSTIFDSDRLNIGCMGPQVRMEFLSVMSTNTLMMKAVFCDVLHDGMECLPPVESVRYFLIDPGKNFELSESVTFEEAFEIIEWFRHDAGAHLSDSERHKARKLSWRAAIGKEDDVYTFRIGDPHCECVLEFRLDTATTRVLREQITVVDSPVFVCPDQIQPANQS